ncbi:MAG: DNA-3-methyladenine glycosylase 2 [Candidatus Omnitrophica bacterium]|nr:DNA-3-methyladenine glycosylase 2 [Candidatus Omnitrophota bacterium]
MLRLHVTDFNLQHTLECGQAFRWRREEKGYVGVVGDSVWKVSQKDSTLTVESDPPASEEEVIHYFSLSSDLRKILTPLQGDSVLAPAIKEFWGLRILRQDPWECLASYIFSSFNNVSRISTLVENLSGCFGTPVGVNGLGQYTFPTAERLASLTPKDLRPIRPGFRDRYLLETAREVAEGKFDLEKLHRIKAEEAKKTLLTLPGVGEKVADCVLLFAYGRMDAFPIDVWVERALRKLYFHGRRRTFRKMQHFARKKFRGAAGYAQEYLYAYVRKHLET